MVMNQRTLESHYTGVLYSNKQKLTSASGAFRPKQMARDRDQEQYHRRIQIIPILNLQIQYRRRS